MLKRMYDWVIRLSAHPRAYWYLAAVAFAESSFFPIPPDPMILTMTLANRDRAFMIAGISTVASVLGGFLGYYIGCTLYDAVGVKIIAWMSSPEKFLYAKQSFNEWGFWLIAAKGLTPIPFKLVTITAGVMKYNLLLFTLSSIIARSSRFFFVAWLLWRFGPRMKDLIEKNLTLVTTLFVLALIIGFFLLKWI